MLNYNYKRNFEILHQFKTQHANQHGEDKHQGFRLTICHRHQGGARAKTRQAPASAKQQPTDHQLFVDVCISGETQHAAQKSGGSATLSSKYLGPRK